MSFIYKPARTYGSLYIPLSILASIVIASPVYAQTAAESEFDLQSLNARGIDPAIASWFGKSARFMPGINEVDLSVNGNERGKLKANFNKDGQLCIDTHFIKQAGLIIPPDLDENNPCSDIQSSWPQAELNLDPGQGHIALIVPQEAIDLSAKDNKNLVHGGSAGVLNYDAQYMDSAGTSSGTQFLQLNSDVGFNTHDWIVRSKQSFSRFNGTDNLEHQAAYAQRTFSGVKKVFQAGQVSLSNSMFGTGQVLGFQMFPEAALEGSQQGAGLVEGIASTQSVAEVRQSGVLIYSTTVPAGPFRLQGFSLLNTRSDLSVTLTGANGEKSQFNVPASTFLLNGPKVAPGVSFGMGKLDQDGSDTSPVLGTIATGWQLSPKSVLNAGLLGANVYQAGALGFDSQVFDATSLSVQTTLARNTKHDSNGLSLMASLSHSLNDSTSASLSVTQQTSGYRELNDAVQNDDTDNTDLTRNQYGGGLSWNGGALGNFSMNLARSTTFRGEKSTYLSGGWSRQVWKAYIGATVEHNTSDNADFNNEDRFYLTLSIPFGKSSFSSYMNSGGSSNRAGFSYNNRSSQDRGWSIASERDFKTNRNSYGAAMDMLTPYSQLSGSLRQDSDHYTSWSGRASGGLVVHEEGVTLSPYQVGDTFGIAKVGKESGVRIDTSAGATTTDSRGYAVLPSLNSYSSSGFQLDTTTLEKNVDINNAWQETSAYRGAVTRVDFDVVRTRRVLVTVTNSQNKPAPYGASVFDDADNFITVVGDNGQIFIPDAQPSMKLIIQSSGVTVGKFKLSLPEKAEKNELYETAKATSY